LLHRVNGALDLQTVRITPTACSVWRSISPSIWTDFDYGEWRGTTWILVIIRFSICRCLCIWNFGWYYCSCGVDYRVCCVC